jgi:hypothetical protein
MRNILTLFTLLAAAVCLAGDDFIASVSYTGTAACSSQLRAKGKYAVRCTTDCHVRVSRNGTTDLATTDDVLLSAGKLYDLPTTATQRYICAIQSSANGAVKIYLNRSTQE